jgi:hypothetical protein
MDAPMDLPSFIRSVGIDAAAALLEERPATVKSWLYGERYPRHTKAPKIIERTGLTWDAIYRGLD